VRFDGAAGWTLTVSGTEQDVSSCISVLERDLADERDARSRGEVRDTFPLPQNDE
jgi:hypothetical protein